MYHRIIFQTGTLPSPFITLLVQNKFNSILPDNYHNIITSAIKNMTKVVLFGSKYTTKKPLIGLTLKERDDLALDKIKTYKKT